MKPCSKCHIEKPLDSFFKRKLSHDGHEAECKDCRKQRNTKWFSENKERHNKMTQDWYNRNKERHLANGKEWYAENKDRKLVTVSARKDRCIMATPSWVDMEIIHYIYKEARRISEETGIKHEVDHIFPLKHKKLCGLNVHWNLQIITAEENRRKANKLPNITT